jgi:hypothetical protein
LIRVRRPMAVWPIAIGPAAGNGHSNGKIRVGGFTQERI